MGLTGVYGALIVDLNADDHADEENRSTGRVSEPEKVGACSGECAAKKNKADVPLSVDWRIAKTSRTKQGAMASLVSVHCQICWSMEKGRARRMERVTRLSHVAVTLLVTWIPPITLSHRR